MNVILILIASIGLQLTAAFLALRLIWVTKRRTAWMLIAIAIFFMALRRGITLFHLLCEYPSYTPDHLSAEVVALVISLLMVFGIAWIAPLFLSIKSSEKMLWESEEKFHMLTVSSPVGMFLDDAQGNAIYINEKCAELIGIPMEEAVNLGFVNK